MMRLFAALPIAEPARGEIARLLSRLRELGWPLRLVHEHGVHLTLKFFGEVPPARLEVIEEVVRAVAPGTGALSMQLAESVSAVKGQVVEGPIRLALGGPWVTAYQPVYGLDADGRPSLLAVNIASGSRVGAGRDVADAWQNLRGLRAPTPPGRRAADPLAEARRLMLEADSAMRAGDWARFGRAFEALRDALADGAPR